MKVLSDKMCENSTVLCCTLQALFAANKRALQLSTFFWGGEMDRGLCEAEFS